MRPRAVIADDETLMREQLRARLVEAWPELEIVAEARNGIEAVAQVTQHWPEVVFLDIRMPDKTGVEAARDIAALPPRPGLGVPQIVFVTAYDQYAIEAFKQGAIDYVLKPAERERLRVTVQRVRQRLAERGAAPTAAGPSAEDQKSFAELMTRLSARLGGKTYLKWIQASVGQQILMIAVEEVLFFTSDEKYTCVQTAQLEALIRTPLKELASELDPEHFWQIHRGTLVNARAIAGISRDFRGRQLVSVKGRSEKLEVSRSYAHLFKGM